MLKITLITIAFLMLVYVSFDGAKAKVEKNETYENSSHTILFRRGAVDTDAQANADSSQDDLQAFQKGIVAHSLSNEKQLRVIQFAGVTKKEWLAQVQATGAEIIGYIPNYAYVIRGDAEQLASVAQLNARDAASDERPVRWMSRLQPVQKIAPELDTQLRKADRVTVEIELLNTPEAISAIRSIEALARTDSAQESLPQRRFLNYVVLKVTLPTSVVEAIASMNEVLFISPALPMQLEDERDMQIIAGNLTADRTQPAGTGYAAWLTAKGLNTVGEALIDFADSGIDRGSFSPFSTHPEFLDGQGRSRILYINNYTSNTEDRRGHGTLVASIASGLGVEGQRDTSGYLYGIGVDPMAKIGSSRIFMDNGNQPERLSFTNVVSAAYAAGARISNNSWGNSSNVYDATAQEYDALARDAQPSVPGNQEMLFVFSSGNFGPGGHISAPGTAKNVITVGASESYRPEGVDSCTYNGQEPMGPDDANNTLDIARFSSGGPTFDGRAKPDIVAPGTHIHGAASQSQFFNGVGICPGVPVFQPPNQQLYTWSSGTSLAAPHVSGAASLARKFFLQKNLLNGQPPSPAMTKAFLLNTASYLNGENAGGNLPQERQGFGLLNLGRAFDSTPRKYVDQTQLFTASGQTYEIRGSLADRSQPLRVTLAWTDAPGMLLGATLINDLDLEVHIGNTVYRGNNFIEAFSVANDDRQADRVNNVEAIVIRPELIPQGADGNFTITVRATNIAGDGVPNNGNPLDQDFALVVTNISDSTIDPPPPPPDMKPTISNVTYVKKRLTITGQNFTAAAQVEINGKIIDLPFDFDTATNSLNIKMKAKKLKLTGDTDNQIILIEKNERSQPFTLRF
jgi:hypothetical protein